MRSLLVAVVVIALPAGLGAEEIRGQVKTVDASKNRLTLLVDEKERTVMVAPKARISTLVTTSSGRRNFPRRTSVQEYLTTLDQLQQGSQVTVMLETQDGSELATQVQAGRMSGTTITTSSSSGGRLRLFRR